MATPPVPIRANASSAIIAGLQTRYGSIDYSRFQYLRKEFYSYVTYPLAGATQLNFFGVTVGSPGITLADTNMVRAGSFGQQHFLLKTLAVNVKVANENPLEFPATNSNASNIASDMLMGFFQAGVLTFNIGARPFAVIPKPLLYCPAIGGQPSVKTVGVSSTTAAGVTPAISLTQLATMAPSVATVSHRANRYVVDPQILIEAEQQFDMTISFPTGVIPILATGQITAGNPLKVGITMSGVILRPMQ